MAIRPVPTNAIVTAAGAKDPAAQWGDLYQTTAYTRDVLLQSPETGPPEVVQLTSGGALVPVSSRYVLADAQGGAGTGEIRSISLSAVPDNMTVRVALNSDGRPLTVVHNANAGAGGGEIRLAGLSANLATLPLDRTTKSLLLKRFGDHFREVDRSGYASIGGVIQNPAQETIDAGHQVFRRSRFLTKRVGAGTTSPRVDDNGDWIALDAACVVTLPNPNVADDDGRAWQGGELIVYHQLGASALFRTHTGANPANALDHDRGAGPESPVACAVCERPNGDLYWLLGGTTAPAPSGPGGIADRVFELSALFADKTTSTSSQAVEVVGSHSHTPGANEKWLYLVKAAHSGTSNSGTNPGFCQVVDAAAPSTPLGKFGRPRYPNYRALVTMLFASTYGATPASRTFRVEAASGAATHSTTVQGARILGLRLAANEGYAVQSGTVQDSAQAWQTIATLTLTGLPAGRYHVLTYNEWGMSAANHGRHRITVDGVAKGETTATHANPAQSVHTHLESVDLTAGSHTFVLQGGQATSGSTYAAFNGIIAVLYAAAFPQSDDAASDAEVVTVPPSTAFVQKLATTKTLKAGHRSLILYSAQGMSADDAAAACCQVRWRRNGAELTPDAKLGTRAKSDATIFYAPVSAMGWSVLAPEQANDQFVLDFASVDGGTVAKLQHAAAAFLALAP